MTFLFLEITHFIKNHFVKIYRDDQKIIGESLHWMYLWHFYLWRRNPKTCGGHQKF